ncbi:hypothetical protein ACXZ3T_005382, partial [Escherichia coli]
FIVFNIKNQTTPNIPLTIEPPWTGRPDLFIHGFFQGDSLALALNCRSQIRNLLSKPIISSVHYSSPQCKANR